MRPHMFISDIDQGYSSSKQIEKSGSPMRIGGMDKLNDKTVFRCREKRCRNTTGRRGGSFFAKSKLPLDKWLHVIYLWLVPKWV